MPQHVRMDVKAQLRTLADLVDQVVNGLPGQRPALAEEEISRARILVFLSLTQPGADRPQFIPFNHAGPLPGSVSSRHAERRRERKLTLVALFPGAAIRFAGRSPLDRPPRDALPR